MDLSICGRTGKDAAFGLLSRKPSPKGLPLFLPDQFLLMSRLVSIFYTGLDRCYRVGIKNCDSFSHYVPIMQIY